MGLPTSVDTLLKGNVVEWARMEFKTSWKPESSLKTICAFANDVDNWGGGYIVLGVKEENGRPVLPVEGVPLNQVDRVMKDLLNKCKLIHPEYLPVVAPVEYKGKTLIVIWAHGGDVRPYSCPDSFAYAKGKAVPSRERTYFIRKMSSTIKPSEDELNELFSLSNKVPFDDRINHNAELSNLNVNLIRQYLTAVGSAMVSDLDARPLVNICEDMGICNNMPEYRKPRNVGLMFFSDHPEKYFPYAQIDVVAFPKGLGGDEIIEQTFKGPLDQQLRDALRYIGNNYVQRKIVKHPDRAEADHIYNYPFPALEEALANAVYHRAYDVREPIEVRVEADRIEIVSYPGPVRSVTREQLKSYQIANRRYRNRRIGEFLKELKLTEGRNTGFKKILDAVKANGSPLPEFETDDDHSYFISRFFIHEAFLNETSELIDGSLASENEGITVKSKGLSNSFNSKSDGLNSESDSLNKTLRSKVSVLTARKRTNAEKILLVIHDNARITALEITEKTGITKPTVERYLRELQRQGILSRSGTTRSGTWIIL